MPFSLSTAVFSSTTSGVMLEPDAFLLIDSSLFEHHVWSDADRLDRLIARRQVLRDGQLERGAIVVVIENLNGAFAEGAYTDNHRAIEILEGASDNLRR